MNYPTTVSVTIGLALMTGVIPGPANAHRPGAHTSQVIPPAVKLKRHRPYRGPVVREMLTSPLATTIWMEARNQPVVGQIAVAYVIKNRVKARTKRYGLGLMGVVTKRKQFSCHNYSRKHGPEVNRLAFFAMLRLPESSPEKREWHRIERLASDVWHGRIKNNIGGATYYATVSINPYWRNDMTVVGQIKDHVFFRPKTAAEWKDYRRDQAANAKLAKARRVARRANARAKHPKMVIHHRVKHVTLAARTHKR